MALLTVDEAQARILADLTPTETEWVGIATAAGRTLAADVAARRTQPPAALSAMDGYAVRLATVTTDSPVRVVGTAAAGGRFAGRLGDGEALRIFTGAPLPDGADTIVIQEDAERDGDVVRFTSLPSVGRFVRSRGLDFSVGDVGLAAGTVLNARSVGFAAAMNHDRLPVHRRPRVAILSSGDELSEPGPDVAADRIIASNGLMLAELVRRAGGEPLDLGIVPDDLDTIRERIRRGIELGADVLCLSGGSSVGDHDLTRPALAAEGVELAFWKIAARPGKPVMFGRKGRLSAIGLPGNPVATLVCGQLYLAPLIRALAGGRNVLPTHQRARLASPMPANDFRRDFVRAVVAEEADGVMATPLANQDSSLLSVLARANALLIRPENAPAAAAGDTISFIRLD